MNLIKRGLYQHILPKIFAKRCEGTIPRSGEEGENVNCYSIFLDYEEESYFLAEDYTNEKLKGLKLADGKYQEPHEIAFSEIDKYQLRVKHYYGLSTIAYHGIYTLAWHHYTKIVYLKLHLFRLFYAIDNFFFKKKKLVTKKRMDLLRFLIEDHLNSDHKGFDILDLMTKLYTIKWVSHPSAKDQKEKLRIYLDSLVESGDLTKSDLRYHVTGKAVWTIERFEEEVRRHAEMAKLQRRIIYLTLILIFVGLVQAGVIRLPTLMDLSSEKTAVSKQIPAEQSE
jgi:hypothetical protein